MRDQTQGQTFVPLLAGVRLGNLHRVPSICVIALETSEDMAKRFSTVMIPELKEPKSMRVDEPPSMSLIAPVTPPGLQRVVKGCLGGRNFTNLGAG
jgi:hypothetical protein